MTKTIRAFYVLTQLSVFFTLGVTVGQVTIYTVDLFLLPLVCLVLFRKLASRRGFGIRFERTDLLLSCLFIALTFSVVCSFDPAHSLDNYATWIRFAALYYCSRLLLEKGAISNEDIARYWTGFAAVLLTVGVVQVITRSEFGLVSNYFGKAAIDDAPLVFGHGFRLSGTVRNPNVYALWVTIFATFWAFRLLDRRQRLAAATILFLGFAIVVLTLSRGAIGTYVIVAGLLLLLSFLQKPDIRTLSAAALVIIAAGWGAFQAAAPLDALMYRVENNGDQTRVAMIRKGIDLLSDPKIALVGIGPGNFHPYLINEGGDVDPSRWKNYSSSRSGIHNTLLQLLVECGAPMFLFGAFAGRRVLRYARLIRRADSDRSRVFWANYVLALSAGFLLLALQVYEEPTQHYMLLPTAVMMAVIVHCRQQQRASMKASRIHQRAAAPRQAYQTVAG